ncbi:MAG: hypothetical protein Q8M09_06005 [Pseudomonadota bacterium]|nr:hypothetical protein [Pseudomonadota bacterium]MDP1903784.1 hypothetical protein [Pseudomonadota bacterium]MDP2353725.1 hypothetical protein [Pseudomonadota bacterium]
MNTTKTTLTLALTAAIGAAGIAYAAGNPFAMQSLNSGYVVAAADSKMKDGKCGTGKCGANKAKAKAKASDMEGKCGGDMGKTMEGKCGGDKAKAMEGKCGGDMGKTMEGKCGGSK